MAVNKWPEDVRLYVLFLAAAGVPRAVICRRYGMTGSSLVNWGLVAAKPRYSQCEVCGEWIVHRTYGSGNRRKYCEGECQRMMRVDASRLYRERHPMVGVVLSRRAYKSLSGFCEVCGVRLVESPNGGFYWCSEGECRRVRRNTRGASRRLLQEPRVVGVCGWCLTRPRAHSRKVCSDDCYRQQTNHRLAHGPDLWCALPLCKECGLVKGINNMSGFCRGCLVGYSKRANRRAIVTGKGKLRAERYRTGDKISLQGLLDRVGRRCHLCGRLTKLDVSHLHPLAPEVDHLIPISRGGLHVWENVAIAHRVCNMKKGNRVANDQLRLV